MVRHWREFMSILVNKDTAVVVQGITGRDGKFHTQQMLEYGTQIVSGVTPGKAGQSVDGVPVYNTVQDAVDATRPLFMSELLLPRTRYTKPPTRESNS